MLLAKTKAKATELSNMIQSHDMRKTYLARVKGHFPHNVMESTRETEGPGVAPCFGKSA